MSLFEGLKRVVNKENIKQTIKTGTAVGAGALLISTTSCDKPKEQTALGDKNKTEVSNDPEFYRQQYIDYIQHPSYKERLAKEMFEGGVIDEGKLDKEYEERKNQIKKVLVEMLPEGSDDSQYSFNTASGVDLIKSTPDAMFHEFSHSLDAKPDENGFSPEIGFENTKNKYISLQKIFENFVLGKIEEFNLASKKLSNDKRLHAAFLCAESYFSNTEIKARLNGLRLIAVNKYGFNLDEDWDINKFEELKKHRYYKELREILNLSDEQISELMKCTAFNNPKNTFYPPGSSKEEFKKGYHIPGIDYGEEEGQA